jgi:hypothetical protein
MNKEIEKSQKRIAAISSEIIEKLKKSHKKPH